MTAGHPSRAASSQRRRAAAVSVALAVTLLVGTSGSGWTDASFTDSEHAGATVTAGTLVTPPNVTCSSPGLAVLRNATIAWGTPTGPAPTGYVVTVTRGTTSTTFTTTGTSLVLSGGLVEGLLTAGTYTITVHSTLAGWRSLSSAARTATLATGAGWTCVN